VDHSWWGNLGSLESLWLKNVRRRNKASNKHGVL
jgi:hypothetical protein